MADPAHVSAEFAELVRKYPEAPTVFAALLQKYMWDDRRPPITRNRLADELDVTRQTVVKWLAGAKPQPDMLPKIAARTGIPLKTPFSAVGYPLPDGDAQDDVVERIMRMSPEERQQVLERIDAFLERVREVEHGAATEDTSDPHPKVAAGVR